MVCGVLVLAILHLIIMFCEKFSKSQSRHQEFLIFGMISVFFVDNILQGPSRTLCSDVCPLAQHVLVSSIVGVYGGTFIVLVHKIEPGKIHSCRLSCHFIRCSFTHSYCYS